MKLTVTICAFVALVSGCGLFGGKPPEIDPNKTLRALQDFCAAYPSMPEEMHNKRSDEACRVIARVCVDGPVWADPPALGNKIVDAGTDGAGGSEN